MNRQSKPNTGRRCAVLKAGAIAGGAVVALAASLPLAAHHSFSAEFDATQVDPATMTFGLGEATPLEPLVISNVDGAFGPDATTKFQVAESGIFCDDTEVTLTGETYSGEPFAGTGEIDASDCQTGGCHPY